MGCDNNLRQAVQYSIAFTIIAGARKMENISKGVSGMNVLQNLWEKNPGHRGQGSTCAIAGTFSKLRSQNTFFSITQHHASLHVVAHFSAVHDVIQECV